MRPVALAVGRVGVFEEFQAAQHLDAPRYLVWESLKLSTSVVRVRVFMDVCCTCTEL